MSMITEQVKRLRSEAAGMILQNGTTARLLREAADTIEQLAAKVRKENGFIFPENPTNGDMIKAMFPNIDTSFSNIIELNLWWNAPYKRGETE